MVNHNVHAQRGGAAHRSKVTVYLTWPIAHWTNGLHFTLIRWSVWPGL